MNRGFDSIVSPATTDISDHRFFDGRIIGLGLILQESGGTHHLAALTIAALRYADLHPGFLNMFPNRVRLDTFDGRNLLSYGPTDRRDARADGLSIKVHRTSATKAHAASKLRSREAEHVSDRPQQRHVVRSIELVCFSIQID